MEPGGPGLGAMRVGEAIAPIESIRLGRHCLWITARFAAKHAGDCGPVTIYSPEGEEFSSGRSLELPTLEPDRQALDTFTCLVTYRLVIDIVNGQELVP